ncbi:aliphatic sulfonate ABC transporter substrate-binding protein [Bradyrhizobium sp. 61]|uniref:aliphatic sulfonate ABC transporter substrate-binding protein n=1 Tax=unclassified Bradyrhizobium TaxID=2631580 RepID=UPI001FF707D6|nr:MULTISPECIES: aliphatic sulfonate ABC transporter substrate-binding protein [unclassified Bradyrhizobium]MCK1274722.1 aliphatic sulfonate ABC transporter substrate-binding protein [Bradyrhizobium sp. 61]MCK1441716.1 aliphatic sulfonate ABC transporter substrate-binding protein [Bradyrhizobium sp. 48]MCK1465258.1 aliphatic sulfonate ABC transporter substrate-binding protein [Bradyrhizobium sp. 2]
MSKTLRIGVHANNPTLLVASRTGHVEKNVSPFGLAVEWHHIAAGARTVDLLGANIIQIGGTGSTPPITAQAKGVPLVYLASSAARPVGGIYVRTDGAIRALADLKGRSVALGLGSWHQTLLATALDRTGLTWRDIVPLDLTETEARAALLAGDIDAWASGGGLFDGGAQFRLLANTSDLVTNPSVFFARRDLAAARPDVVSAVAGALHDVDGWIAANPDDAAQHLAAAAKGPLSVSEWRNHIAKRPWGLKIIDDAFIADQQRAADLFVRFGLLPWAINVRDAVLAQRLTIGHAA